MCQEDTVRHAANEETPFVVRLISSSALDGYD